MRGDSIRDFYAKTLALLGLGVLACAGALVDYWPVGVSTPAVATPFGQAPLEGPLASRDVGVYPAPPLAAETARIPGRVSRAPIAQEVAAIVWVPSLPVATAALPLASAARHLGSTLRLRQPDISADSVVALAADTVVTSRPMPDPNLVAVANLDPPIPPSLAHLAPAGASPSLTDEGDGLLTGAFKKAGSSIVRTGAKTGASIFDTFRVVSGMVRRALPTN